MLLKSGRHRRRKEAAADFLIAVGSVIPAANTAGNEMRARAAFECAMEKSSQRFSLRVQQILVEKYLQAAGHRLEDDAAYKSVLKLSGRQEFVDSFKHIEIRF